MMIMMTMNIVMSYLRQSVKHLITVSGMQMKVLAKKQGMIMDVCMEM